MLVYAVRSEFSGPDERERYLAWLRDGHVADVVAGGALAGEVVVLDDGSVESRYVFPSREAFVVYEEGPAVALRSDGRARFPGVRSVRSVGERVFRGPSCTATGCVM